MDRVRPAKTASWVIERIPDTVGRVEPVRNWNCFLVRLMRMPATGTRWHSASLPSPKRRPLNFPSTLCRILSSQRAQCRYASLPTKALIHLAQDRHFSSVTEVQSVRDVPGPYPVPPPTPPPSPKKCTKSGRYLDLS